MKKEIFVSIVIPCYNEEQNLKRGVLKEVYDYLITQKYSWEVIVSDDGSTDKSTEIVTSKIKTLNGFRLLKNKHGGKPSSLLFGVRSARGEYILFSDMDQSTPIGELEKLIPYTTRGIEVIIGSRGLARKNFPLYRKLGAYIFSGVRRMMILPEIVDTQCGFKLIRADVLKELFPKLEYFKRKVNAKGWVVSSWDVEFLHMAKKRDYKIKEVLVVWKDRDVSTNKGGALQKYVKESREMFLQILRIKINEIRGLYVRGDGKTKK